MATFTRIIFRNMSPIHLGTGRDSYDTALSVLSSDTLSSALAAVRAMEGRQDGIDRFLRSFTVSSAFPYFGDEFYLPRPQGRLDIRVKGLEEKEYRKKLKKLRYISSSLWLELMNGKTVEIKPTQLQGDFLTVMAEDDFRPPMLHVVNQRVMVPREEGRDAVPFMFEWTFFQHGEKESGLYCLVDGGKEITEEVVSLFKDLGTLGIGSDRTAGGGFFDVETDEVEWQQSSGNAVMLLSAYIPKESELEHLNLPLSNYSILKRGGFMAGSSNENMRKLRRKTVYMFDVGSVFQTNHLLEGTVVDLAPQWNASDMHPVFRSGRPLFVNVNINNNEE